MRVFWAITFLLLSSPVFSAQQPGQQHRLADSLERKLNYIRQNGAAAHPNPAPTILTEEEINDYFASGKIELPKGVKKVSVQGQSGVVTGFSTVDFDELRGQRSSNPLLSVFSG